MYIHTGVATSATWLCAYKVTLTRGNVATAMGGFVRGLQHACVAPHIGVTVLKSMITKLFRNSTTTFLNARTNTPHCLFVDCFKP